VARSGTTETSAVPGSWKTTSPINRFTSIAIIWDSTCVDLAASCKHAEPIRILRTETPLSKLDGIGLRPGCSSPRRSYSRAEKAACFAGAADASSVVIPVAMRS